MTKTSQPIPWTIARLIEATGGDVVCRGSSNVFASVSIDSRNIDSDALFVAIKGDVHDGHSFVRSVVEKGVRGLMVDKDFALDAPIGEWNQLGITCIAVDDTTTGLGALASLQRKESGVTLIAITGSNGKTSTRSMTASVIEQRYKTLSTSGNFNNEIGLPLTLLRLGVEHEWAVVELGMNAPGEITRLGEICTPDFGIITNIGEAHLEGLGSLNEIAAAKGELLDTINPGGKSILNTDDPLVETLAENSSGDVVFFGFSEKADIRATHAAYDNGRLVFDLTIGPDTIPVTLNTPGLFMVSNALAAATAGFLAGLTPEEIKAGLEAFSPVKSRMNILKSSKGYHVIDDTYNANPVSMREAVKTLAALKGTGRGFFVSGDMMELGEETEKLHRQLGEFSAQNGVNRLYSTGTMAPCVADGALAGGLTPDCIFTGTKNEIINTLLTQLEKSDWVLIKGSRSMTMEDVVKGLLEGA